MRELFSNDIDAIERTVKSLIDVNISLNGSTIFFPLPPPDKDAPIPSIMKTRNSNGYLRMLQIRAKLGIFHTAFPPPKSFGLPEPEVSIPPKPDNVGNICSYFEWYCEEGLKVRLAKYDRINHDTGGKSKKITGSVSNLKRISSNTWAFLPTC